ncbi:5528_t:CDS:1, partial [Acaulospora colombiana]
MLATLPLHAHAHVVHTKSNKSKPLADTILTTLLTPSSNDGDNNTTATTKSTTTRNMTKSHSSIHELQAPNFKRTDSTDKVRLRVEEMATHRENGTVPTSGSSRFGADGSNNYMKGMQYTFAVDPRVKPIATTTATSASNTNGAQGAEGGKSMMGKMRVRPMHPPPVPPGRFKAEPGKDGDMTMHGNAGNTASNGSRNEHAMDVSEDHSHA